MSSMWKVACFLLISSKIIETQSSIDTFLTLLEEVQKFYLTPSTFIVFDRHEIDFRRENILLKRLKRLSNKGVMSQAITYDHLERLKHRRENTLYSLIIHDHENFEHIINVTKGTDMSMHPWLLYINKNAQFDCDKPDKGNFFKLRMDTRMTAICEGNTILKNYYAISENQTEVMDLAIWRPEELQIDFKDQGSLIRAYMNLKGITLKVASKVNRSILTENVNANLANFNYQLLDEVSVLSNFNTEVVALDGELGYFDDNTKNWYGMMKIMNEKVADIGLALVTMSHTRMRVVDYVIPLAKGRCNLYAKLPDYTQVLWTTYFKVFDKKAWSAIGLSILIFSILVYLIENGFKRLSTQLFIENFLKIWGIFSMQSPNDTPSSTSIKIIYFSILFISIILNATYSASITSYIAVLSPELPFSNFEEFLRDKTYDFIVVKGSRDYSFVLSNTSRLFPLQKRLKETSLLPTHAYEGFQQACEGKTVFYTDEVKYDSMQNFLPCKLGAVSMELIEYMSFVVTKNSPYKKTIDYNILRLMDYGILHRLKEKYFQKYIELPDIQPSVISLNEVWSIIIIWGIGLIITVIGLFVEIIVFKLSSTKKFRKPFIHNDDRRRLRSIVHEESWSEQKKL